ncbi:MAG TPA: alpha/beta hydrolase-fold protein [Candidatus Nanopelagicales bacterium]|nr:alpha/beta hydrolase-fold protein [Candidatus Nanopelagicales bacterium]
MYVDPNLPRHLHGWQSPQLGLEMPIASYGDRGPPLLLFPRGPGDSLEAERCWLIKSIEPLLLAGRCRVFCVDSINRHAWQCPTVSPAEAARRHALYASYVEDEVVPYIRRLLHDPHARVTAAGAEFGAFHAANQLFRRPDLFGALVGLSGLYDLEPEHTRGHFDENVYFNNPVSYLANLHDPRTLERLRRETRIYLVSGKGEGEAPERQAQLAALLTAMEIPHELDLWGADVERSWTWWGRMLNHALTAKLGW